MLSLSVHIVLLYVLVWLMVAHACVLNCFSVRLCLYLCLVFVHLRSVWRGMEGGSEEGKKMGGGGQIYGQIGR